MKHSQGAIKTAVACSCAAAFGAIAVVILMGGQLDSRDWAVVLAFAPFVIVAANLDVLARGGVGMSGTAMLLIGAVVAFHENRSILGALIVAACVGADLRQIRSREWLKVSFNAAASIIAVLLACLPFFAIASQSSPDSIGFLSLAVLAASVSYVVSSTLIVSIPVSLSGRESYWGVARDIGRFELGAFAFALLGLGLGWVYLELGAVVVPLLVVPILIARSTFASYLELRASQEQTIETLILALEAKDRYTAGHAQRVAMFCAYVGEQLCFSPSRMERLRYAALMHDIGKLIVPNQLLNKPGRLTEAEFERVRRHEGVSVELLHRIDFLAPIAGDTTTEAATAAVGGEGLVEPAIIHVADAFDAMTSTRSYRKALSQETAFGELRDGSGTQFNGECVEALIRAIEQRGEHYGDGFEVDTHEWEVAPPEAGTGSAGLGDLLSDQRDERVAHQ